MKALPDETPSEETTTTVVTDGAICDRGAAAENGVVIDVSSSESDDDAQLRGQTHQEDEETEQQDERGRSGCRKSKKKHRKHRNHKRCSSASRHRSKRKKHKKRVDPIFLWTKRNDSTIVSVMCEDYDRLNRLILVKTPNGWRSNPRSTATVPRSSRSSTCAGDSEEETDKEPKQKPEEEPKKEPAKVPAEILTKESAEEKSKDSGLVDQNDNSIDFVDIVCSGDEDEQEQRARIDRALEMIEQDPALMSETKIKVPVIETNALKLPEGTTIHQIKLEDTTNRSTPPLSPSKSPVQCTLTIIPQQQQQNEPLNLETVSKRSALEISLQEPPLKKKRGSQPSKAPLAVSEPVKHEYDPLSELKEVLSNPGLSVPDPLLVPRARLAALVASPAKEIPKLLKKPPLLPPPDPDMLVVSLSHLQSMLLQQPGFMDERKSVEGQKPAAAATLDQMLWLPYLSSKEMSGSDADLISGMLSLLMPKSTTAQQPFNYAQQQNQWQDRYYSAPPPPQPQPQPQLPHPPPYDPAAGYGKPDDCGALMSQLLPSLPQQPQLQQPPQLLPPPPPRVPPPAVQSARKELCCNGSPSACYENCWPKAGYNPFAVSPTGSGLTNAAKTCAGYPSGGGGTIAAGTNFYSSEIGYANYNDHRSSTSPVLAQESLSPYNRVQFNYQPAAAAALGVHQQNNQHLQQQQYQKTKHKQNHHIRQQLQQSSFPTQCCNDNRRGGGDCQSLAATADKSPAPVPTAPSSGSAVGPLQKPKIKVKKHLIDPNATPNLINIEGALRLAGANPEDVLSSSSPLWHPLFGR